MSESSYDASTSPSQATTDVFSDKGSTSSFALAKAETRAVRRSKRLVLFAITIAAALVGFMTYWFVSDEQEQDFQSSFADYAAGISELVQLEAMTLHSSVRDFSLSLTSNAIVMNSSWPNVTFPHFVVRGVENLKLSRASQMTFAPLVTANEQQGREAWTHKNEELLLETMNHAPQKAEAPPIESPTSSRRKLNLPEHVKDMRESQHEVAGAEESSSTSSDHDDSLWQTDTTVMADTATLHLRKPMPDGSTDPNNQSHALIPTQIWQFSNNGTTTENTTMTTDIELVGREHFAPVWQQVPAPVADPSIINFDLFSHEAFLRVYRGMKETSSPVLSEVTDLRFLYEAAVQDDFDHPHSFLMQPVFQSFASDSAISGVLIAILSWGNYFINLAPPDVFGVVLVVSNTCGDQFSYRLDGPNAIYLGPGDRHDPMFAYMRVDAAFAPLLVLNVSEAREHCEYAVSVYPSSTLHEQYMTNKAAVYTAVIVLVFFCTAAVFILYDYFVQRRQNKVMETAKRTNAIVTSMFPSNVRDQVMKQVEQQAEKDCNQHRRGSSLFAVGNRSKLKIFLDEGNEEANVFDTKPIAEFFPDVTIMFADIVGFTAWSSVREPSQVFTLLETLFHAFDQIAARRRVFKVETVGDCYVAVAGLPDPRKDHPIVMARFARDVLYRMNTLTKTLETKLGPDTGDLTMRIGMHSGQVTAGVLRGDKSRFQLFGDTMNTASRIESTGERNRIHVSVETATLLMLQGKQHWLSERDGLIRAKGKGEMQTYWLDLRPRSSPSVRSGSTSSFGAVENRNEKNDFTRLNPVSEGIGNEDVAVKLALDGKTMRLIGWNSDLLARLLKQIVLRRTALGTASEHFDDGEDNFQNRGMIIDEVKEIITLPRFETRLTKTFEDTDSIELHPDVLNQLETYVSTIASLYRNNPFHNFEHASHVTMSVSKLLSRIVAPDDKITDKHNHDEKIAAALHDHTYGITSDPLTQFACLFSALIHDCDHTGVPNTQLVKENVPIAAAYNNKSVAEQNSVDIAWSLLMEPEYAALRKAIYADNDEKERFRQLVVNSVMATDIMDKKANRFRKTRWNKAFNDEYELAPESEIDSINRKATIVIEHMIQASDVAHTMQHWHIYSKWNEKLFHEMLVAYRSGRAEKDPCEFWYDGEIGFFDHYIIPLAMKLQTCGVFGVSSDEYLNYATHNRNEWEVRGKERVAAMIRKYADKTS